MQKVQTLVTSRPEIGARALILLGAFVSFVLSVVLWGAIGTRESSSDCGCRRSSRSAD